jgi:hypothetical protein
MLVHVFVVMVKFKIVTRGANLDIQDSYNTQTNNAGVFHFKNSDNDQVSPVLECLISSEDELLSMMASTRCVISREPRDQFVVCR